MVPQCEDCTVPRIVAASLILLMLVACTDPSTRKVEELIEDFVDAWHNQDVAEVRRLGTLLFPNNVHVHRCMSDEQEVQEEIASAVLTDSEVERIDLPNTERAIAWRFNVRYRTTGKVVENSRSRYFVVFDRAGTVQGTYPNLKILRFERAIQGLRQAESVDVSYAVKDGWQNQGTLGPVAIESLVQALLEWGTDSMECGVGNCLFKIRLEFHLGPDRVAVYLATNGDDTYLMKSERHKDLSSIQGRFVRNAAMARICRQFVTWVLKRQRGTDPKQSQD